MEFFKKIQQFFMSNFLHSKFFKMRWICGMSRTDKILTFQCGILSRDYDLNISEVLFWRFSLSILHWWPRLLQFSSGRLWFREIIKQNSLKAITDRTKTFLMMSYKVLEIILSRPETYPKSFYFKPPDPPQKKAFFGGGVCTIKYFFQFWRYDHDSKYEKH